ncbi:MAG: enoyl-CoA hydratase/isomerase family protein [Thermoleophilia bacterium]
MAGELIVERDGHVVRLTLNRPEQRNALTPGLIEELLAALDAVDADAGVRCVLLTGAGTAFCAGYDINAITSSGGAGAGAEARRVEELGRRLRGLRVPVVAKVNGAASGAGCDLAVSCDVRFASEGARFAMPPARLGVLYEAGGMLRLLQTVGLAAAKEMLLAGTLLEAERALQIGLVNRVFAQEELDQQTDRFVEAVVHNAPLSVQASKLACNLLADAAPLPPEAEALLAEASRRVWASEDAQEGPRAFRERRPPAFQGR